MQVCFDFCIIRGKEEVYARVWCLLMFGCYLIHLLFSLANKIKPGICAKPQKSPAPFVQMVRFTYLLYLFHFNYEIGEHQRISYCLQKVWNSNGTLLSICTFKRKYIK